LPASHVNWVRTVRKEPLTLPESVAVLRVRGGVASGNEAFDRLTGGRDDLRSVIADMPSGVWPVAMEDGGLLSVFSMPHGNERMMIVRRTDRESYASFLSTMSEGIISVLFDSRGTILASSPPADAPGPYDISDRDDISRIIAPKDLPTFWTAVSECRNLETVHPFSISIIHGDAPISLIASLRQLPGGLFLLGLSAPTFDPAELSPPENSAFDTVFGSIPTPAVVIGPDGRIIRVNDATIAFAKSHGANDISGSDFLEWVAESDKAGMASTHELRMNKGFAPFRRSVKLLTPDGAEVPVEITTLLLPDGEDTLVFVLPTFDGAAPDPSAGLVGSLSRILDESRDQTEQIKTALDLLKAGTRASGVSILAGGRLHASGDVPLDTETLVDRNPSSDGSGQDWTRSGDGTYTYQTSMRLRSGMARVTLYGLDSPSSSAVSRLVLSISPYLVDCFVTLSAQKSILNAASAILDTWDFMGMGDSGPEKFLARAADVTGAEAMIVWGAPGPDGSLQPVVFTGVSSGPDPLDLNSETAPGWSYAHSEPVYVADSSTDGRFSSSIRGFRSEVAVPLLRRQGRATGVLLALSRQPGAFPNPAPNLVRLISIPLSLWLFPENRVQAEGRTGSANDQSGMAEMEDVLLSLSHRLRSPVTAMKGFCDMLSSKRLGPLNEEQLDAVESLSRSSKQIFEQLERLLSFLRLELQPDRMEGSWGRPAEILEAVLENLAPRIGERDLQIHTDIPQTAFTAFFDRQRLEEVIWNLLDNAVKFTAPGGSINVRMRSESSSWTLDVEDTGTGIPAKSLPYVFDRFYRGGGDDSQGLGIGLSIVRRFTEAMGGTINVFSREGRGSRFMLRLPVPGRQE